MGLALNIFQALHAHGIFWERAAGGLNLINHFHKLLYEKDTFGRTVRVIISVS